jgi:hypothetical protein
MIHPLSAVENRLKRTTWLCLWAAAVLFGVTGSEGADRAPSASHLEPATLANVVFVSTEGGTGTAFLMKHGDGKYLVTARHVVTSYLDDPDTGIEFRIGGRRGRSIPNVECLKDDLRADVAVFTYKENEFVPYFAEDAGLTPQTEVHLASQVYLVGYPASLRRTYGVSNLRVVGGCVAGLKKYVPGSTVEYIDIDMPGVEHGHSGGPILLLPDRVVALAVQRHTGRLSQDIGATYAVPIQYVTALIDGEAVAEDRGPLNEMLRNTALVFGLSCYGKTDFDVWAQRIDLDTGEAVWGDEGLQVVSSRLPESEFVVVPSDQDSTIVVHNAVLSDTDVDVRAQKISKYGELEFYGGVRSATVGDTDLKELNAVAVGDSAGGAIVAYELHLEDGDVHVLAQRIGPDGSRLWNPDGPGAPVATAQPKEMNPTMVSDGAGGAIIAFEFHLDDDVDVMAQRIAPDGKLLWHNGDKSAVVGSSNLEERHPRIVTDGKGGAIVFYEMLVDGQWHLMAQRLSPFGEMLWNEGARGVTVIGRPLAEGKRAYAVISDGHRGAFVVAACPDPEAPEDTDIVAQRIAGDGSLLWGELGDSGVRGPVFVAYSKQPERNPVVAADGKGGIVVAFEFESAPDDLDVYAQRVNADGALCWNEGSSSAPVGTTRYHDCAVQIPECRDGKALFVFEIRGGRGNAACQALSIETGEPLYQQGKSSALIVDSPDREIRYRLRLADGPSGESTDGPDADADGAAPSGAP